MTILLNPELNMLPTQEDDESSASTMETEDTWGNRIPANTTLATIQNSPKTKTDWIQVLLMKNTAVHQELTN